MKKLRSGVIVALALVGLSAGAVSAESESQRHAPEAWVLAAVDLDCLTAVDPGQGGEPVTAASRAQEVRLREYLDFHAQALDDGRLLLPWSLPTGPTTH